MVDYIGITRNAAKGVIELLNREKELLNEKQDSFECMHNAARSLFERMKETGFDSTGIIDLHGLETAKERFASEVEDINTLIGGLSPAYNSLAGALLQIAKQGISFKFHGFSSCPNGRRIGTHENLKNVIWQGRNQAMHYEEGRYNQNVRDCFQNLFNDFGTTFNLGTNNLALAVIDILGWDSYSKYENDLISLLR